ncbi:anaerobic ribonucleotide reductase subunit [Klebsiella phage CPRSA]|nr:anaerobic ribonucleotide reductase subunit [Klebsiella phage CPRSA]
MVNLSNKEITNENANKDARVFPTQRDLLAGIVAKHFARNHILPKHIVEAHDSGDIHYHDLDYSPFTPYTNCCLVDLKGMLENGFKMGNADIEPPKSSVLLPLSWRRSPHRLLLTSTAGQPLQTWIRCWLHTWK